MGTADADYAEYYGDAIKTIFQTKNIQLLTKNQISHSLKRYNKYEPNFTTFSVNVEKLDGNINSYKKFSYQTLGKFREMQLRQIFSEHTALLSHFLSSAN